MADLYLKNRISFKAVLNAIADLDHDKSGFLTLSELEDCFMESFSDEFKEHKKDIHAYFVKYALPSDKLMINYRKMKEEI